MILVFLLAEEVGRTFNNTEMYKWPSRSNNTAVPTTPRTGKFLMIRDVWKWTIFSSTSFRKSLKGLYFKLSIVTYLVFIFSVLKLSFNMGKFLKGVNPSSFHSSLSRMLSLFLRYRRVHLKLFKTQYFCFVLFFSEKLQYWTAFFNISVINSNLRLVNLVFWTNGHAIDKSTTWISKTRLI